MKLPYTIIVQQQADESGLYFVGRVIELDGCFSDGETREKALAGTMDAMEGWIETRLENGFSIPEPMPATEFDGNFTMNIPLSLHRRLSFEASREKVSLNQYALYKLSA
jgi:predicted RNase H-like HicB family nuclease